MPHVLFVDTSVLLNLLAVPGFDQDRANMAVQLSEFVEAASVLILPTAAIIETGNHITHVSDGGERRAAIERFAAVLEKTISRTAPWELNSVEWSDGYLRMILDGSGTGMTMAEQVVNGLGVGDLTILAEAKQYRNRTQIPDVRVWSLDRQLNANQEKS